MDYRTPKCMNKINESGVYIMRKIRQVNCQKANSGFGGSVELSISSARVQVYHGYINDAS